MTDNAKVAIVTGGGTGLGAAISVGLAARGVRVVVNYARSAEEAEATAAAIRAKGGDAVAVRADVTDDTACRRLAEEAQARYGRIDILVNNAGTTTFSAHGNLDGLKAEDWHRIYGVNVVGAFQMTRAVVPAMKAAGFGAVVNVASIAGVTGIGSSIAYAASKGAMITMTLSLARALAPAIRVNAVCPGFIGTRWFSDRMSEEQYGALVGRMAESTPLKQAGTPDLVADAVLFLALDGARHITGETLLSDGGLHLELTPMRMG